MHTCKLVLDVTIYLLKAHFQIWERNGSRVHVCKHRRAVIWYDLNQTIIKAHFLASDWLFCPVTHFMTVVVGVSELLWIVIRKKKKPNHLHLRSVSFSFGFD